jgi:hypothetical protein
MQPQHVVVLRPSRDLCGTTEAQFAELLVRLAPFAAAAKTRREDRPGRKRAPGAGQKGAPLWLRLMVALTHLRQGSTTRATAEMFGIHERSVRNWRDELEELLAEHGYLPPGAPAPIRTLEDLETFLETHDMVMVDGTEVPSSMPIDWDAQRAAWSGKTKDHVVKATVVATSDRRPVWFEANPTGEGRTHDVTMLRAQLGLFAVLCSIGSAVLVDKAYQGLWRELGDRVVVPHLTKRGQTKTPAQKRREQHLSAQRMPVEHAVGRMKTWRALRYWRRPRDRFARGGRAIAILASFL